MSYEDYDYDYYDAPAERPRDPKTDEAKAALEAFFNQNREGVYYGRQLEVLFERRFFHWITNRALNELVDEGKIKSEKRELEKGTQIRFFFWRGNRYWTRKAKEIAEIVREFSRPELGLGAHGEMMIDAALAGGGFVVVARGKVRSYGGKEWTETGHDLDRIYMRDGIPYGSEIKNTLDYIPRGELDVKLRMCEALGLNPLFVMRMAPKNYMYEIVRRGGYGLLFGSQLYPFGHDDLIKRVREKLGLPVDCPRALAEGRVAGLVRWHEKKLGRVKKT